MRLRALAIRYRMCESSFVSSVRSHAFFYARTLEVYEMCESGFAGLICFLLFYVQQPKVRSIIIVVLSCYEARRYLLQSLLCFIYVHLPNNFMQQNGVCLVLAFLCTGFTFHPHSRL